MRRFVYEPDDYYSFGDAGEFPIIFTAMIEYRGEFVDPVVILAKAEVVKKDGALISVTELILAGNDVDRIEREIGNAYLREKNNTDEYEGDDVA